jgi:ectoine hydroxylase-related dioxygenase (phytanoyl-CoA dioxygenase family)
LRIELNRSAPLTASQIGDYRRDGFLRVERALSEAYLTAFRDTCLDLVRGIDARSRSARFLEDYDEEQRAVFLSLLKNRETDTRSATSGTYARAFTQVTNLWRHSDAVRELVFSARLAEMAAGLLDADGVRIYHDQALIKEAGGGHTPWHVDQFYWPLAGERTVTLWIPLQAVSAEMGPLAFAPGSQALARQTEAGSLAISDESEARLAELLADYPRAEAPFELGEVSFHNGWVCHRAGANTTEHTRAAFTIIYMAADAKMIEPQHENHQLDAALWLPGVKPGDIAASHLNPQVFG